MNYTAYAPIALFIFRRPVHTRRMIEALKRCEGFGRNPVFVFCEGPRDEEESAVVEETRRVARELLGDAATYVERERNLGLAKSIKVGITRLCDEFGRVIVIEDDLIVAPEFLEFMNEALNKYQADQRVMQVGGHMFDVPELENVSEALFLPVTSSWGWATWKRAWDHFDMLATGWQDTLGSATIRKRFNFDGYLDRERMLRKQLSGKLDTWDIQWHHSVIAHNGLVLYPPRALVQNVGFDGSGTHYTAPVHSSIAAFDSGSPISLPDKVEESQYKHAVYRAIRKSILQDRLAMLRAKVTRKMLRTKL